MTRNKIYLAISMLARIGTGLISLLVLARGLGPTEYGFIAAVFAYSAIAALLTDFGFTLQALRDIGAEPHRAGELIMACLRVKTLLIVPFSIVAFLVALSIFGPGQYLITALLLYFSVIALSYGDLALISLRGIGNYKGETYSVVAGSAIFIIVVGAAALIYSNLVFVSVAIFVSRISQSFVSFHFVRQKVFLSGSDKGALSRTFIDVRKNYKSAAYNSLLLLSAQIDAVIISSVLGLSATATYQVGSRLSSYFDVPSQVISNIYLPELAKTAGSLTYGRLSGLFRMQLEYFAIGLICSVGFFFAMPTAAHFVLGSEYSMSAIAWGGFSSVIMLRYAAVLPGLVLVARGKMTEAIVSQVLSIATMVLLLFLVIPLVGGDWAPWAIASSLVVNSFLNYFFTRKEFFGRQAWRDEGS